jgi:methionyl-tRNA formyltransferase
MKVVFMGTPQFAVPSLQKLIQARYDIASVVTQPDRKSGRGYKVAAAPVKALAQVYGIPVLQFEKIRAQEGIDAIKAICPDIIVTAAYGQIVPKAILDIPRFGCINVHASLLPKYRGAAPIQWAIINGEEQTGVTIMYMDPGLDTGDIISSSSVPIGKEESGGELYERLSTLGADLLVDTLEKIENGTAGRKKQVDAESSYYPPLSKELGKIDWQKPAAEIHNLIRALDPVMGTYTMAGEDVIKIWSAQVLDGFADPGRLVHADAKNGLVVGTGAGLLKIDMMQAPGAKKMSPEEFFRGRKLSVERFEW